MLNEHVNLIADGARQSLLSWTVADLALESWVFVKTSPGITVQSRRLDVDEREWGACQECQMYRSCYDFCLAKLGMARAPARL